MLRDKEVQALFEDYYFERSVVEVKKRLSYTTTTSTVSHPNSIHG